MGYDRMSRNCYDQEMVRVFRDQVKRSLVPFVDRLQRRRAARIGVDRLELWDEGVYFPQGNPVPAGTPEEILAAGQRMYQEMSPETREFMDFMMDNALFDVLGRKNKRAGGYMTYLPYYKSPFIFAMIFAIVHRSFLPPPERGRAMPAGPQKQARGQPGRAYYTTGARSISTVFSPPGQKNQGGVFHMKHSAGPAGSAALRLVLCFA